MEEASPGGGGLEVGGVYQLVLALIVGERPRSCPEVSVAVNE